MIRKKEEDGQEEDDPKSSAILKRLRTFNTEKSKVLMPDLFRHPGKQLFESIVIFSSPSSVRLGGEFSFRH
jgi:hypothetical protein